MGEPKNSRHVVLLVEPNRSLSSLLSNVLTREGYSILTANTSEEALELCAEVAGIDLLITDVFLPGASGIDLAKKVSERNPDAKILFLSSVAETALRQQGISDRATVLIKPLAISDLVSRVHELLRTP
jgi:DNA-binding response OmpR family regulator